MNRRILLLYGGKSSEHEVSVMGYRYISSLLKDTQYDVLPVYISPSGEWLIGGDKGERAYLCSYGGGSLYTEHGFIKIDVAIPLLHGDGGEDGTVQGALELMNIPYVGADTVTSAVCIDKYYTKCIVSSLGIPTVDSIAFTGMSDVGAAYRLCRDRLDMPTFIKPRRLGSSIGAYPARSKDEFYKHFPMAMRDGNGLVIVERLLSEKRELECAFYEAQGVRMISNPGEVLIDGFYGYGEKYNGNTPTVASADIDRHVAEKILVYSHRIADALDLRHLARIDFFLTEDEIFFNEVNTFPGFTENSLYPKMLQEAGIDPREALISFIEDALLC